MSFEQYPDDLLVQKFDSNETLGIGQFRFNSDIELRHAVLTMYKQGAAATGERARMHFYSQNSQDVAIHSSDWALLDDFSAIGTNALGEVRFDFSRAQIDGSTAYNVQVEMDSYTRNANVFYYSYVFDWPAEVNRKSGGPMAAQIKWVAYEKVTV